MRRAIVISIPFHLLVMASLMELHPLPSGAPKKTRESLALSVALGAADGIDKNGIAFRGDSVNAGRQAARAIPVASPAVAKSHGNEPKSKLRGERSPPNPVEAAENVAFLPADLEREYRISLARAARQSPYSPVGLMLKGQVGIVRMTILYWSRLGRPNVTLEQSSGYRELDREALRTIALAIARVPLPEGVQGGNFRMQYALEYRLAD